MFWPRVPYFDVSAQSFIDYCDLELIDSPQYATIHRSISRAEKALVSLKLATRVANSTKVMTL